MSDRVELTDAEREALLFGFGIRFYENADHTRFAQGVAAVESIIAARIEGYSYWSMVQKNDALRAELAAANTRAIDFEQRTEAWHHRADMLQTENAALQATLDRVTALADEPHEELRAAVAEVYRRHDSNAPLNHVNNVEWVEAVESVLRAALTPEGKRDGCGVCLTCDPPQDDPRFGFPIMQRMYVCGTCGNKRCPASVDCLKWECSGRTRLTKCQY